MAKVASKVAERIAAGLKKFQPILESARTRDVNESDTVVIVTDMLQEVLGYDKYSEITSEHAIRGTYCDLAIKVDGKLTLLIEVKAIGLDLKGNHVKQAVDYAANQGCEWVLLTNGICWQAFRVSFEKPIQHEIVVDLDLLKLSSRKEGDIELLWVMSRDGCKKDGLDGYHSQRAALSRFTLAALLQNEPVLDVLRRELRRVSPDAKIEVEDIKTVLVNEVLKRDVLEGDRSVAAKRLVARAANRALRKGADKAESAPDES
ncbi:MAG: type I restriction enzyme HsdR N-terminal domain-containing protein [Polyangiaceae bacterium]|nr:type I restriction enzyme HsdR N-terminal domain-containing protein [Polyangiaceae bacterium]